MCIMAGDYEKNNGEGGKQLVDGSFSSEWYPHECDEGNLMCVERNVVPETSSQFLLTTSALSYMKDQLIVVGSVIKGMSVLKRVERVNCVEPSGEPTVEIQFSNCGCLKRGEDDGIVNQQNVAEGDIYASYPTDQDDAETTERKLEIADDLRDMGNQFFKQNHLAKALEKYEKAFRYLAPGMRDGKERSVLEEREILLLGNIAAIKLKQDDFPTVIELCCKVLQLVDRHKDMDGIDGIETKAKFRRGVAYFQRGDWLNSYVDFSSLLEKSPTKEIESWHKKASQELEKYRQKEKCTYSKLFD